METFEFDADLWVWSSAGGTSWFFVTLPADLAADIRVQAPPPSGFGSIRVEATIGSSVWRTSLFPQAESKSFLLPVKKAIRQTEEIDEGDPCAVSLVLVD